MSVAGETRNETEKKHWQLQFELKNKWNWLQWKFDKIKIKRTMLRRGMVREKKPRDVVGKEMKKQNKGRMDNFLRNPFSTAKPYQRGQLNQNGVRHDLDQAKQDVLHGKVVDDLVIKSPMMYHIISYHYVWKNVKRQWENKDS